METPPSKFVVFFLVGWTLCLFIFQFEALLIHDVDSQAVTLLGRGRKIALSPKGSVQNEAGTNDHSCLSFDNDIDALVSKASHIFVVMPDKAAGMTLKSFMGQCEKNHKDGLLRYDAIFKENALSHSMEMPTLIADHVEREKHLLHTIEHSPSSALIIYIYREESDREASAIQHVAQSRLCAEDNHDAKPVPAVPLHYEEDGSCIIDDEDQFIESVIKARFWEIGYGVYDTLTCKTYEAIENEGPNMIMINYKQADNLLKIISKHRCPSLEDELFRSNVGSSKKMEAMMKLRSGQTVTMKDWVKSKKGQFGFFQPFHDDYNPQCKAKTRKIEKDMLKCQDEAIRLGGELAF